MTTTNNLNMILNTQDSTKLTKMLKKGGDLKNIKLVDVLVELEKNKSEIRSKFIKELVENNIDIYSSRTKNQLTSLMLLAYHGLIEVADLLIEKNVDIHAKDVKGMNAFLWAVAGGNINMVEYFLDKKADIQAQVKINFFTYDEEKKFKRVSFVKKISAFAIAFNKFNFNIITLLIDKGFDINEDILEEASIFELLYKKESLYVLNSAINYAFKQNNLELSQLLMQNGINNLSEDNLENACKNLNFKMIKVLVEDGVKINPQHNSDGEILNGRDTPLEIVCTNSLNTKKAPFEIIDYLIKKGADVKLGNPLMAISSVNGHGNNIKNKIISLLIENGANVNFVDEKGQTPLMKACNNENYDDVKILIEHGANINHKDKDGNTALMLLPMPSVPFFEDYSDVFSGESTSQLIINYLLDNGADINAQNKIGLTALMKYAYKGNEQLTKTLLDRGADITLKSEMTAFFLASKDEIKEDIQKTQNNTPQRLVKLLSNFTIDKPIKFTTHWENDSFLQMEYGDFDTFIDKVKKEFLNMQEELKKLSPNLYKKVYSFLLEQNPDSNYTWCNQVHINIGWSSLAGLKEHYNSGKNPYDFKLAEYITIKKGIHKETFTTFGDIINLFKQEIEIRVDFKNLETIFSKIQGSITDDFNFNIKYSKLQRQFYTDTEMFNNAIEKIFAEIKKRKDYKDIYLTTKELEDRSLEIKIIQKGSKSNSSSIDLQQEVESGDFATIKGYLTNLCDWSVESSCEDGDFRINYLHSNNVKKVINIKEKIEGFTHILRFYR